MSYQFAIFKLIKYVAFVLQDGENRSSFSGPVVIYMYLLYPILSKLVTQ